jgi:hypothetical protein
VNELEMEKTMMDDVEVKFNAIRPGQTERFRWIEFSTAFGDDRVVEAVAGGLNLGSSVDRFIGKHRATHLIEIGGDEVVVTGLPIAS